MGIKMVKITKKSDESPTAFVRRFSQRVLASGLLREAKTKKYYHRRVSRTLRRAAALERKKMGAEFVKLRKLGRLKPKKRR